MVKIGRRGIVRACLVLAALALMLFASIARDLWQERKQARAALVAGQVRVSDQAAADISSIMREIESVAAETAQAIAALEPTDRQAPAVIARVIARHPDIAAIGVAFEPFAYDPGYRLAAPLVRRGRDGGFHHARIEADYDYTAPTVTWYREAMEKGRVWDHPAAAADEGDGPDVTAQDNRLVDFALRIKLATGRSAVVRVSYPLAHIAAIVTHLDLGHHGYGVLLGAGGQMLVSSGLIARGGDEVRRYLQGDQTFRSTLTGHDSRLVTRPVAGPGWTLATVHSWRDLQLDFTDRHRRYLMLTMLAVALPVLLGIAHVVAVSGAGGGGSLARLAWIWSSLTALAFTLGITVIWALALEGQGTVQSGGRVIASRGALDGFEREVLMSSLKEGRPLPSFIPTGVFVQSVEFLSANNLMLTGYVWQRYAKDQPLTRGLTLPEAEEAEITEVLRRDLGREEVIVWRLRATLRQSFSYVRFPFDREAIWLRLWPADLERPVVLVPDFSSYNMTNPSALPGLERSLFISGWTATSSFFDYRHNGYNSDFGIDASMSRGGRQELYFNIGIVRNFLDPFVSHITPILLVLLLIFAMQMTVTRKAEQKDLLGFNAATIITTCAALFFAVLISHIEVRGALSAKKIFYGEYFYLITYAVILAACINAILFTHDSSLRWVQYRDNILAKILYWPVVMAAMYLVTFATFY